MAIAAKIAVTEVIREEHNDIRPLGPSLSAK
jgi:hypothetical protein